jgi:hypothetical protein
MKFEQKRFATRLNFDFGDTELRYGVRDNSGEAEFSIGYADIPFETRIVHEKNMWLRNVGVLWVIIGTIQIALAMTGSSPASGSAFWFLVGAGCLAAHYWMASTYTVMDAGQRPIYILQDKKQAEILSEIRRRRKEQLLSWYTAMNFDNDPDHKIKVIHWLQKNGVLSHDEADRDIGITKSEHNLLPQPDQIERQKLH